MGTWGPGNLDSDYALDELDSRGAELVRTLLARARRPHSRDHDEYDYTTLFVEFELLFALEKAHLFKATHALPSVEEVDQLTADYLAGWDAWPYRANDSFEAERRTVIRQTFAKFRRLCRKHGRRNEKNAGGWVKLSPEETEAFLRGEDGGVIPKTKPMKS